MATSVFFLRVAAVLGGLGIVLGAFGAHALRSRLPEELQAVFETGVRYHLYHAIALLALALANASLWSSKWSSVAAWSWTAGIVVFSGSLYLLAATNTRWLGAITPIGGVLFIIGWAALFIAATSHKS